MSPLFDSRPRGTLPSPLPRDGKALRRVHVMTSMGYRYRLNGLLTLAVLVSATIIILLILG